MAKKKKRKRNTKVLGKTLEAKQPIGIPVSNSEPQTQEQHFELFSFPVISLHENFIRDSGLTPILNPHMKEYNFVT